MFRIFEEFRLGSSVMTAFEAVRRTLMALHEQEIDFLNCDITARRVRQTDGLHKRNVEMFVIYLHDGKLESVDAECVIAAVPTGENRKMSTSHAVGEHPENTAWVPEKVEIHPKVRSTIGCIATFKLKYEPGFTVPDQILKTERVLP